MSRVISAVTASSLALLTVSRASWSPSEMPATGNLALKTTVCELTRKPSSYFGKLIEVRARVNVGLEWSDLWDVRCNRNPISFSLNPESSQLAALNGIIERSQSNDLVVATLVGTLKLGDRSYPDHRPLFVVATAREIVTRKPPICPWTLPPPPRVGYSFKSDPCNPENWLRTHPNWTE